MGLCMSKTKTVRKGVVLTLGLICMILTVVLVGVTVNYVLTISDRDNSIASLNSKITSLQNQVNNLTQTLTTAKAVAEGFQLTITLAKTKYSLGEPIIITLTITNVRNQTNTIDLSAWNNFDFQVYNDTHVYNGTSGVIYQYSDLWIGQAIPYNIWIETLDPGESLSENLVWMQTYPVSIGGLQGVPVSPGT